MKIFSDIPTFCVRISQKFYILDISNWFGNKVITQEILKQSSNSACLFWQNYHDFKLSADNICNGAFAIYLIVHNSWLTQNLNGAKNLDLNIFHVHLLIDTKERWCLNQNNAPYEQWTDTVGVNQHKKYNTGAVNCVY